MAGRAGELGGAWSAVRRAWAWRVWAVAPVGPLLPRVASPGPRAGCLQVWGRARRPTSQVAPQGPRGSAWGCVCAYVWCVCKCVRTCVRECTVSVLVCAHARMCVQIARVHVSAFFGCVPSRACTCVCAHVHAPRRPRAPSLEPVSWESCSAPCQDGSPGAGTSSECPVTWPLQGSWILEPGPFRPARSPLYLLPPRPSPLPPARPRGC